MREDVSEDETPQDEVPENAPESTPADEAVETPAVDEEAQPAPEFDATEPSEASTGEDVSEVAPSTPEMSSESSEQLVESPVSDLTLDPEKYTLVNKNDGAHHDVMTVTEVDDHVDVATPRFGVRLEKRNGVLVSDTWLLQVKE